MESYKQYEKRDSLGDDLVIMAEPLGRGLDDVG